VIGWLKSLLTQPKPAKTTLVPPPDWRPPEPTEAEMAINVAFARHPDRKARREAVVRALGGRLDAMLTPLGFQRRDQDWLKPVPKGEVLVKIQRFRGGVNATLVVGFLPKPGFKPKEVATFQLTTQLPNFVQISERTFVRTGNIDYAFADHDPAVLDFPLAVLRDRALPWATDLSGGRYSDVKPYRERALLSGEP
jgi:hypothetical protein